MDRRIGIVPLPIFVVVVLLLGTFIRLGKVPADLTTNILTLAVGGFACAEIGKHLPGLKRIGAAAILATFVPSYLVYVGLIPGPLKESIATFTNQSNFLYLFIGSIIVGSILGMDRHMLIGGFLKIFVPIVAGSLAGYFLPAFFASVRTIKDNSTVGSSGIDKQETCLFRKKEGKS